MRRRSRLSGHFGRRSAPRARVWRPDGTYRAKPLRRQRRRLQVRTGRWWSSSRSLKLSRRSMRRSGRPGAFSLAGSMLAGLLAFVLARRMTHPIHLLEKGTERIGAGQFDHRIEIKTGDELERLADSFNAMAVELAVSQERHERISKLKRFWLHKWPNWSTERATTACSRVAAPKSLWCSATCGDLPPSRRGRRPKR